MWQELGIIVAIFTFLVTIFSFFLAIRLEIKKSNGKLNDSRLLEEKRLANHEQRMSVFEEKLSYIQSALFHKLDDINQSINDLRTHFINHLKDKHNE